jgi:hypothetical protein
MTWVLGDAQLRRHHYLILRTPLAAFAVRRSSAKGEGVEAFANKRNGNIQQQGDVS